MRLIGYLEGEKEAATFSDYLLVQRIANQVERERGATFAVWINDEEQLDTARTHFERFKTNPAAPEFQDARGKAKDLRAKEQADLKASEERRFDRSRLWPSIPMGAVTIVLMAISVWVYILSSGGDNTKSIMGLFITEYKVEPPYIRWKPGLPEVMHDYEVWRLLTPIFIHYGILHIVMNLLWLKDLGSQIEFRKGGLTLVALVITIGVLSNLAQYGLKLPVLGGGSPTFGGMSGVVYGLLGYIWMKGKFDPRSGLELHTSTVVMMLIWLVICLAPRMHIANNAHVGGLLVGMIWGILSSAPWRKVEGGR